ncbi:hypothetical protein GCM10011506_10550 [Marivirga lumbricoides]|uniref:VWA domain-containing protein n=1 Tax=Marivirga lumbricoides TaxID=1046115 RepID=A0ABQ1LPT4_9BACT|nr:hypothetical protein GCM10011506_10550 [Marivirga lumbricoides]
MLSSALSSYWIIVCLLIGLAYSYFLYSYGAKPWSKVWNRVLFVLRFLVITTIAYLFLEPFLSTRVSSAESSKIVFLWDDSQSLTGSLKDGEVQQLWRAINDIAQQLQSEKSVEVEILNLNGDLISGEDSVLRAATVTPIDPALKQISQRYETNLISEVVLFSDGIYNRGISPEYFSYPFKVSTVGIGDTVEKKDVELKSLNYNKVSYEGNRFPIVAEIVQNGWDGKSTTVAIYNNGKLIDSRTLNFQSDASVQSVEFLLDASKKGFQSYSVKVNPFEEEYNKNNNQQTAYINVVEGKKKILLLAGAPHPDIKALQKSIEQNENYEFYVAVEGLSEYEEQEYDLAILFHLPNEKASFTKEINQLAQKSTPLWFVTGFGMNISRLNAINKSLQLLPWSDTDEAGAYINPDFDNFDLTSEQKNQLRNLPPVNVPFGDFQMTPRSVGLFFKQIGSVKTDNPIFVFYSDEESKQATLLMEGFWKWRLVEHLNTGSFEFFDEWVSKSVRYLTANNEKDQFKLYPSKEEFSNTDQVVFKVELYNQVYDRVYGNEINLKIENERDSAFNYQFTPDRVQPDFILGTLPSGVYRYTGSTQINEKKHENSGQFIVRDFEIEQQNLVADFELLKRVAAKNDGEFFLASRSEQLLNYLNAKTYPEIITGDIQKKPLTENYWLYLLIFLLLFSEWFIRRYHGSY